jgi:hypothetical protein
VIREAPPFRVTEEDWREAYKNLKAALRDFFGLAKSVFKQATGGGETGGSSGGGIG